MSHKENDNIIDNTDDKSSKAITLFFRLSDENMDLLDKALVKAKTENPTLEFRSRQMVLLWLLKRYMLENKIDK